LTKLVRVDTSHRQPRREQGTDDPALVTTARLKANRGDCERAQPCDQLGPAGCVVTHRKEPPLRQHHHVQAVLRHVDTAKREHGHLRIPSLLMRARALATVRAWKKRLEHQAHSRFDIRGACGLPVATGAELCRLSPCQPSQCSFPDIHGAARSSRCWAAPQPRGRSPCCQRWAQARRAASLPVCGQLGSISKCTPCLWGPVTVCRLCNGSADEAGLPLPLRAQLCCLPPLHGKCDKCDDGPPSCPTPPPAT